MVLAAPGSRAQLYGAGRRNSAASLSHCHDHGSWIMKVKEMMEDHALLKYIWCRGGCGV